MKKVRAFSLCLMFVLLLSIFTSGCEKSETGEFLDETIAKSKKSAYTISEDLVIRAVYMKVSNTGFGKHLFVFVKNCTDDTIIDYSVAYIGFDLNGNVTRLENTFGDVVYGEEKMTLANILPGDVYGLASGPIEGISLGDSDAIRYVRAVVSYIKFKSGREWEMGDLDSWAQDAASKFSVEEQKNYVQTLKNDAQAAMNNPYLSITETKITRGKEYVDVLGALDFDLSFKNIGNKAIRSFSVIVAEFDSEGKGVVLPNQTWSFNHQYITNNSIRLTIKGEQNPQESHGSRFTNAVVGSCSDCLLIVDHIEFTDDTVWNNDCASQFMMFNESEKLL